MLLLFTYCFISIYSMMYSYMLVKNREVNKDLARKFFSTYTSFILCFAVVWYLQTIYNIQELFEPINDNGKTKASHTQDEIMYYSYAFAMASGLFLAVLRLIDDYVWT